MQSTKRFGALTRLALIGLILGLAACAVTLREGAPSTAKPAAPNDILTYISDDAAYSFDYPADATLQTSDDASLRFKLVYVQFSVPETSAYQGASVMVIENATNTSVRDLVAAHYRTAKREMPMSAQNAASFTVGEREAIKLERDGVIGDADKYTVLVAGDGVVYRINLYGGGVGGSTEPPPSVEAMFDHLVQSFRVTGGSLKPKTTVPRTSEVSGTSVEPPIAQVFSYPLHSGSGLNYGVPTGIVVAGTRMEWLDYAVRNLDQWRTKCYGVDWARMIHTGQDWYRSDYLTTNTAGSPVYAVADGIVELQNPGISYPGNVVLLRHHLPDGRNIYSMYGHVANVSVVQGQLVSRGQQIATVFNQGYTGRTPNRHPTCFRRTGRRCFRHS